MCVNDCIAAKHPHPDATLPSRGYEIIRRELVDCMKKRTIQTCLLALLMLIAAFPAHPSRAEEAPFVGDMTGDGITTAADAAAMLRAVAFGRLSEDARPDLDFTKNGEIDGVDVRAALYYACGSIPDWVTFGERVSSGLCDERLFDRFSYTGTQSDENGNYRSENVSVRVYSGYSDGSNYHFADVYIQDITCFVTAFGSGKFRGSAEAIDVLFDGIEGAIVALNGDYYSIHVHGPVVRNGETFEDHVTRDWDIAVLKSDGELVIFGYGQLKKDAFTQMRAYQTWVFGPSLLDENGQAKEKFRSNVQAENPRSALGYYEPGHYAFLAVDGRSDDSTGMTMQQLSQLCEDLGFASAYNMDGGQSSILFSRAGFWNEPYHNGRPVSDILAIRELPEG